MDLGLTGRTAIVCGASSGIGAALAPMLASRGATVGIVARRRERLEEVLARCTEHSPDSRLWAVDLGDLDAAEQVGLAIRSGEVAPAAVTALARVGWSGSLSSVKTMPTALARTPPIGSRRTT